jgi:AcrR family transcriptional regulator
LFRLSRGNLVKNELEAQGERLERRGHKDARVRIDAQRNIDALLQAAIEVFSTSGVDAPVREIVEKAGVGIGTYYRHFPQRADLVAAVFRREIDACADAAPALAAQYGPREALARWMQ